MKVYTHVKGEKSTAVRELKVTKIFSYAFFYGTVFSDLFSMFEVLFIKNIPP